MSPMKYAKKMVKEGKFPQMQIVPGNCGVFYLESAEFETLDGFYMSREKAEKTRSAVITKATNNT